MVFGSANALLFIAWNFETTSAPRKRERNIWVPFLSTYAFELASLEKKKKKKERKKERKKMMIFDFFKIRFLGLYKAERKSEDIFVLRRVRAFHRYPFC